MQDRNNIIDFFKGIAIIAVILYHAGLFTYGYLGVDIFLVVGGYLITKSITRAYQKDGFSFWNYICNRLVRLWPLALVITIVSLAVGYFTMLPDGYKNACETAVGTATFTNNFIQYITAGNYWDTSNDFKPLMHTWYLGVIFQFYVFYPLIFMACYRCSKKFILASTRVLWIVFAGSLAFYILHQDKIALNFYMLPSRLFEFAAGGLVALRSTNGVAVKDSKILLWLTTTTIILLFVNASLETDKVRLLITVGLTIFVILYSQNYSTNVMEQNWWGRKFVNVVAFLGMASYSLYLWHQPILAFYRNIIDNDFTVWSYLITLILSIICGLASYKVLEQFVASYTKGNSKRKRMVLGLSFLTTLLIITFSIKYYRTQGVVRDIPELDVRVDDPKTFAPQEYNARISVLYNKPFPSAKNGKKNVLVVGDSYARDWINVILESNVDNINLVYSQDIAIDLRQKIAQADIVFVANNAPIDKYVDYLPAMMKKRFFRVGHKCFDGGVCGIYNQARLTGDYIQKMPAIVDNINKDERIEYEGMYINLMDSISDSDGKVSLFTKNRKLISHDGLHLTKVGAQEFARRIDIKHLLEE